MMDPWTLAVAGSAVVVLGVATWWSLPRPPDLDGERWFKTWLITLLRGQIEAEGGTPEAWAAAVLRHVPWHPAGRHPERKVLTPEASPPTPALDGELALHSALAALPDVAARWERMYDLDEEGLTQRLEDPALLGEAYDPARWLGSDIGWEAIADPTRCQAALARATEARWVIVGERFHPDLPDLETPLAALLGAHAHRYDPAASVTDHPQAETILKDVSSRRDEAMARQTVHLMASLHALAPSHSDHLILVGVGASIHLVLEALRASAVLRDQVDAVVSVGGVIQGLDGAEGPLAWEACTTWLQSHYRHDVLDLEAAHQTPYFSIQWLDRSAEVPGACGLPIERSRFPTPPMRGVRRQSLQPVDLGVLPAAEAFPTRLGALALWGVVTAWMRAQRG